MRVTVIEAAVTGGSRSAHAEVKPQDQWRREAQRVRLATLRHDARDLIVLGYAESHGEALNGPLEGHLYRGWGANGGANCACGTARIHLSFAR